MKKVCLHILILLCLFSGLEAQETQVENGRAAVVLLFENPVHLANHTVVPGTVVTKPEVAFAVDNRRITLDTAVAWDSVMVSYREFDFDIEAVYRLLDTAKMQKENIAIAPRYKYRPRQGDNASILGNRDINYAGSFSRGFSVGNAQSLVLNSNFNLQLAGDIGEGVKIVAAISDDNIPIQPEGNTQVLQEFDRVYIKLSKEETSVVAGDYNLINPRGYFSRYNKRLQGISVEHTQPLGSTRLTSRASAAAARGKFARQTIATTEGNQGPYKLQGNNGERFIIIQSGSERVYVDGRLMKRGFEYDYIIDYNRAEVTFTPTRLITKDERVVVEFEYSDQSYLRTAYAVDNTWETTNGVMYLNLYSEQDSRTATGTVTLDSTDVATLSSAGDDPLSARRSGVRSVEEFDGNSTRILYEWQQVDGDSALVFTAMPTERAVVATFSEVAQGEGAYVIADDLSINGRVYRYVGPGEGNYLPSVQLVAPEQQQMLTAGVREAKVGGFALDAEVALSRTDQNRLSSIDDQDNVGYAGHVALNRTFRFARDTATMLGVAAEVEAVGPTFNRLNPYRAQEFARDWTVDSRSSDRQEWLYSGAITYQRKGLTSSYVFKAFDRQGLYNGNRHLATLKYRKQLWDIEVIGNLTSSRTDETSSNFYRPKVTLTRKLPKLGGYSITLYNEIEHNQSKSRLTGDFTPFAISYDLSRFIVSGPSDGVFSTQFKVTHRRDRLPFEQEWVHVSGGTMLQAEQAFKPSDRLRVQWSAGLRTLQVDRPDLLTTEANNTLVGRLDLDWKTNNSGIVTTTSYALDAGQEPKLEFVYFRVENPDLGEYVYLGEDDQGLDQSLFVYRPDDPRSFWRRTSQFNNEFIATNNQSLIQSFRLDFKRLLSAKEKRTKMRQLLRKVSLISNVRLTSKVRETGGGTLDLGRFSLGDTSLVSGARSVNTTFFWNRGDPLYDIQIGRRSTANKIVQIVGADTRSRGAFFSRVRVNAKKYLDIIVTAEQGDRQGFSEQFENRNFDIEYWLVNPSIQYRPTSSLRLTASYEYQEAEQLIMDREMADVQRWSLGCNYRTTSRQSLDVELTYANIDYQGEPGSVVEFELLQSLQGGRNILWDVSYIRRIGKNVDLSISYQGRRTGELAPINTARAQVKATF